MEIRKFWMKNGNDQTIQFADSISKIFINNPAGLGINNTLTTFQYTDRLDLKSTDQNFQQVNGEYLFYDYTNKDKYEQYNDFVTFLTYKPLVFYYQIPTDPVKTYYTEVEVVTLDKTEVKKDGVLRCNFTLQQLTRWSGDEVVVTGTSDTYTIEYQGHMPVGFELTINGSFMKDVVYTLEQNESIYGVGRINSIGTYSFRKVYVNSNDGHQDIILENSGGSKLANPLSYQDITYSNGALYVTFLKLARGTSTLKVSCDVGSLSSVEIKYTPIYRSV